MPEKFQISSAELVQVMDIVMSLAWESPRLKAVSASDAIHQAEVEELIRALIAFCGMRDGVALTVGQPVTKLQGVMMRYHLGEPNNG